VKNPTLVLIVVVAAMLAVMLAQSTTSILDFV
jgi:hypothetical protein